MFIDDDSSLDDTTFDGLWHLASLAFVLSAPSAVVVGAQSSGLSGLSGLTAAVLGGVSAAGAVALLHETWAFVQEDNNDDDDDEDETSEHERKVGEPDTIAARVRSRHRQRRL